MWSFLSNLVGPEPNFQFRAKVKLPVIIYNKNDFWVTMIWWISPKRIQPTFYCNKSNYLIIIHHLRSFENYAFVNDVHKFFSFCSQGRTGHENRVDGGKNSGECFFFFINMRCSLNPIEVHKCYQIFFLSKFDKKWLFICFLPWYSYIKLPKLSNWIEPKLSLES